MLAYNQVAKTHCSTAESEKGFTLIELSIVLVIIGLIVGGVLVGQDLIRAAEVRATITQIEKYNTAVNTFRGKFNALPGDMTASIATTFGFSTYGRAATPVAGQGDGNFVLDGGASSTVGLGGETILFWVDLSSQAGGNLIDGGFSNGTTGVASTASTSLSSLIPAAKLGRGNSITVFENGGVNFYMMENISAVASGVYTATNSLSVAQAYNIDKKVDDGIATTGNVTVALLSSSTSGVIGSGTLGFPGNISTGTTTSLVQTTATSSSATCFESTTNTYSVSISGGAAANCSLAFKFQ